MNRETRSRAFTSAMVGLAILSIIPPLLLAVAQAAGSVQLTDAKIIPSHTFHVIGAHRIPAEFTVPATLATLALWMTTQMQVLRDNVRKGCPTRFMTEKGIHFAVTFVWTGCAYLLLKQGGIMPVIEHVTLETRPESQLAGFSTAPERRNTVVNDVFVHPTRFNHP